ncbi:10050_t:CDS:10 [Entrophospora sp. SA101]|nr:10050_t:CDS:10 [Entrophospora sp. SA101]
MTFTIAVADNEDRNKAINLAITNKNIIELRRLAITGPGFMNDGFRRLCWPLLLHTENYNENTTREVHKDEYQVLLDVHRSFVHYPQGLSNSQRKQKQRELNEVIVGILRRHPKLSYYQGFHDICSSLLLVLGKEGAIKAGGHIAMFLLRYPLRIHSLEPILKQLNLIFTLLRHEDPLVADLLLRSNTLPYFCLSWVITWCSHDLRDFSKIARLFDFFIASHPLMIIYLSAKVVLSRKKELLTLELDSDVIHTFLSKFPQNIDIDDLISKTHTMYQKFPPEKLQTLANSGLDQTSCINLYNEHWLTLKSGEKIDYAVINEILSMPPSARKPITLPKNDSHFTKRVFISAFIFTAAILLIWLIRLAFII